MINDIILSQTSDTTYDWRFDGNNFLTGTGNSRLQSAVLHATLLRPYEMEPELYQDKGCKAHDYVKDRMTQHVQTLVEEGINESIQNIHGVQEARTTIESGEMGIKSSIVILRDDGEEVVVDGATI